MGNNQKAIEINKFFQIWSRRLGLIVLRAVAADLGFKIGPDHKIMGELRSAPARKLRRLRHRKTDLKKFIKSFSKLYARAGVLKYEEGKMDSPFHPELSKLIKNFDSSLNKLSKKIDEQSEKIAKKTNRRRRIPTTVAFEVARAIHFCSRDPVALSELKKILASVEQWKQAISSANETVLKETLKWLQTQIENADVLKSMSSDFQQKGLKLRADETKFETRFFYEAQRRIWHARGRDLETDKKAIVERGSRKKFGEEGASKTRTESLKTKSSWTFTGDRSRDDKWAAHLKQHLIRTILSDGQPVLIKAIGRNSKKKTKLIERMESANRKTLNARIMRRYRAVSVK